MAYLIETVNKINCKRPRNDGLQLREYLLSIHVRVLLHLNTERARLLGSNTNIKTVIRNFAFNNSGNNAGTYITA